LQFNLSYKFCKWDRRCNWWTKSCTNWSGFPVLHFSWTEDISICLVFNVAFSKSKGVMN